MNIQEFRNQFPDEETCRRYLEQMIWPSGRTCPHCGGVKSWDISADGRRLGRYECAACGKQFTVTTKTPLHSTKLPLRTWLMAMYFMINSSKGISSVYLAKWIGTSQKTAWKVGHAVRAIMASQADAMPGLAGIVELDEKYLGGKPRYQKDLQHKRGRGTTKSCVFVAASRDGQVRASVVANDSYAELAPRVNRFVATTADLMSDQLPVYQKVAEDYASHASVNHGAKEFVNGETHNNTAESFNAILERAKQGVFHFLSKLHLQRYVSEVVFRWNHRFPAKEISKNGMKKIIYKAKPILEQLQSLLMYAVGTQLRRSTVGGIFIPKPAFRL
jgi:transposase-like protein